MLRSLHIDGSEFKQIRELEEVGSMLCDIDTWPEKWMQIGMDKGMQIGVNKGMQIGMNKGMDKGMQIGVDKGKEELAREIIFNMLEKQKTISEIAELTNLSEQQIQKIIATATN